MAFTMNMRKYIGIKRRFMLGFTCTAFITTLNFQASKLSNFRNRKYSVFACTDFIKNLLPSKAFTMADRRSSRFHILSCALAFTMAEILISLTIIGVIAAITLPALQANINEKTWATQRKALHARMTQAIALMPSLNGYGIGATDAETASKAAQAFITDGLSKVLKINNICDSENFKKCGFPDEIRKFGKNAPKLNSPKDLGELNSYLITTLYSGATVIYKPINTISAVFETTSGESILTFYNPKCTYAKSPAQRAMCANFVYDLNGRKGPNQVGKDIGFMTAFYPTDSEILMPTPFGYRTIEKSEYPVFSIAKANQKCHKIYGENTRMANIEELMSLYINNNFGYHSSSYTVFLVPASFISSAIYDNQYYTLRANYGIVTLILTDEVNNYTFSDLSYNNFYCVK